MAGAPEAGQRTAIVPTALPLSEADPLAGLVGCPLSRDFQPDVIIINALRDVLAEQMRTALRTWRACCVLLWTRLEDFGDSVVMIDHFNKAGLSGLIYTGWPPRGRAKPPLKRRGADL